MKGGDRREDMASFTSCSLARDQDEWKWFLIPKGFLRDLVPEQLLQSVPDSSNKEAIIEIPSPC